MGYIDLTKYGITGTKEIIYNPSYETLFRDEMDPSLEGYEKGYLSELGAVDVDLDLAGTCGESLDIAGRTVGESYADGDDEV